MRTKGTLLILTLALAACSAVEADTKAVTSSNSWPEFTAHVVEFTENTLTPTMDDIVAASDLLDYEWLKDASIDLWIEAGNEIDWLDNHQPDACYRHIWENWRAAMVADEKAGDMISDAVIYMDAVLMEDSVPYINKGSDLMEQNTDLLPQVDC